MVTIRERRPELLEEFGVGPIVAATVLPETSTACLTWSRRGLTKHRSVASSAHCQRRSSAYVLEVRLPTLMD